MYRLHRDICGSGMVRNVVRVTTFQRDSMSWTRSRLLVF
jgi:hypothetical protein